MFLEQTEKDSFSNKRTFEYPDFTATLERHDPYGLISIKFNKGVTPPSIAGNYTSFFEAERALETYVNSKKK